MNDFNAPLFCECFLYACQPFWFSSIDEAMNFPLIYAGMVGGRSALCGEMMPIMLLDWLIELDVSRETWLFLRSQLPQP